MRSGSLQGNPDLCAVVRVFSSPGAVRVCSQQRLEVPLVLSSPDLPLNWPGQAAQALFPFTLVPGGAVNDVQLICVQRGIRKSIV